LILLPKRIRKDLGKCISYKGNFVVNLVNQKINNGCIVRQITPNKFNPVYSDMMIRNIKDT
jgi:hypothetical protein